MAPPGATARWRAPWLFCWALRQHDIGPTRAGVPRTGWKPKIWTPHAAAVLAVRCLVHERCNYNLDYDLGDLTDTGAAVVVTTFRPSENQAVLVVAAADTDAVEARLRPQLGELLCVVASKWTRAVFDAVRAHLDERWERWNLLGRVSTARHRGARPVAPSRGSAAF